MGTQEVCRVGGTFERCVDFYSKPTIVTDKCFIPSSLLEQLSAHWQNNWDSGLWSNRTTGILIFVALNYL